MPFADAGIGINAFAVQQDAFLPLERANLPVRNAKDGAQHIICPPSVHFLRHEESIAFILLGHFSNTLEYCAIIFTISCEGSISNSVFLPSRMKNR